MKCLSPYVVDRAAYPCGKCMPCLINRRETWTNRILLEASSHEENCFVTLTYGDLCLPGGGSVSMDDVQGFFKRLRKRLHPRKIRYFYVGEYGDTTWRPHYHAIVFGLAPCTGEMIGECACESCFAVKKAWHFGHVMVAPLTVESARYVCKYVTKRMTSPGDPRLKGKRPEFCQMSRRPGLGANATGTLAECLERFRVALPSNFVPSYVRHGKKKMPLGRYLKRRLREFWDLPPPAFVDEELQAVRCVAFDTGSSVSEVYSQLRGQGPRYQAKGKL